MRKSFLFLIYLVLLVVDLLFLDTFACTVYQYTI